MGLDVSLYTKAEEEANNVHEKAWDEWYHKYKDDEGNLRPGCTKEQMEEVRKDIPDYGHHGNPSSEKYPDHHFNRRYLRSSYNESGFNRAVPDMVGEDHGLYWIFEPVIGDNPEPSHTVLTDISALEQVKERALQVAEEMRQADPLRVSSVHTMLGTAEHMWHELPTEDQVLEWYREEQIKHAEKLAQYAAEGKEVPSWVGDGGYSNAKGDVLGFNKGMEILAITLGANPLAKFSASMPANTVGGQMGLTPHIMLVYRMGDESKESYIQSAEITAEFCDEAIELIKADGECHMHWSG